jgi:nicotinamidase/pyrazinamidase
MASPDRLSDSDARLVIDIQNDFCPGGALAVPGGDRVVPVANQLMRRFRHVVLTQDWHPPGHSSFASSHPGKAPFETIPAAYGEQVLWPEHCVQATPGAEFHPDLDLTGAELITRKGFRAAIDSYSAFYENDHATATGLAGDLRECGYRRLYLCGIATDFCVKWSALDGRKEGFEVSVILNASAAIDLDGSLGAALDEMREAGVRLLESFPG